MKYAGIGARNAPAEVLQLCELAGQVLADRGWVLRSGHAPGCDQAFERGAGRAAEVYLPWPSFEKDVPIEARYVLDHPHGPAHELAGEFHPGWDSLKRGVRQLMARNMHEVLGAKLDDPVLFVLCWTPDGSLDGSSGDSGGTGQALRLAAARGILVFNLAREAHAARVWRMVNEAHEAEVAAESGEL